MAEKLLKREDVAEILGVSLTTASRYMDEMPCFRFREGGHKRVKEADLLAWISSRTVVPCTERKKAAKRTDCTGPRAVWKIERKRA